MDAASKDAAIAALQRVAEVTGKASASQGSVAPPPGAVDQGTVKRDSAVDSDVDKILSSALSELGLDGDGGPDRVVRIQTAASPPLESLGAARHGSAAVAFLPWPHAGLFPAGSSDGGGARKPPSAVGFVGGC